jgi:hypothetical protein
MAINFGILQPIDIAGKIAAGQQEAQRNQLAQQQLAMGGLQQQKAQLELGDFQRRQAGLDSFIQKSRAAKKSGSEEDMLNSYEDYGLEVGDPQHIMNAQELRLAFNERKAYMGGGQQPQPVTAAPSAIDLPASDGTSDSSLRRQAALETPVTANAPFVETRNLPARGEALPPATPVDNNLIPAAAPVESVNQLGAPAARSPADIQARIIYLNQFPRVPAAKAEIAMLTKELEESRKLYTVGGNLVTGAGKSIFTAPKEITQTDLRKNFDFAQTPAGGNYKGSFADFKAISTPKTSVTYGPQEKAEKIEYGKLLIEDFKNIKAQATVATKSLPAIESNLAILDKGFDTGFGKETIAAGASVLGALGVQDAKDYATDAQTFLANANAAVLQRQLEQKGQQTEADAQRITATGAQLGNTKDANRFVLTVAKAQLQRDLAQRNFYATWREKNGTFEGAEDAWYAGAGGKSLFDTPALKKYAAPTNTTVAPAKDNRPPLTEIFKNN